MVVVLVFQEVMKLYHDWDIKWDYKMWKSHPHWAREQSDWSSESAQRTFTGYHLHFQQAFSRSTL